MVTVHGRGGQGPDARAASVPRPSPPAKSRTSASRAATSWAASRCCPASSTRRARDAPGWGSVGGMTINGQTSFNFSYDGVTNKDTGSNSGNYAAPGARLDRGSQGAGVQLPGRVRPQLGGDDHGRHQERHAVISTARAAFYKRDENVQHEHVGPPARSATPGQTASCAQGALPVQQHGVDDRRSGARSRHRFQQEPRQAVLLLLAGPPAAQRPGHAAAEHACRPRSSAPATSRRRSTATGQQALDQGSAARRSGAGVQRQYGRARLLPGQQDSGEPHQPDRRSGC